MKSYKLQKIIKLLFECYNYLIYITYIWGNPSIINVKISKFTFDIGYGSKSFYNLIWC